MTWTKLGTEFFDQLVDADFSADLDDACQLTHAQAIHYLYSVESYALTFKKKILRRFATSARAEIAAVELVRCGVWEDAGDSYKVVHHENVIRQSLAAQSKKLEGDRARQARKRARDREGVPAESGGAPSHSAPPEHVPEVDRVSSWEVAPIGQGLDMGSGELHDGGFCLRAGCQNSAIHDQLCADHARPLSVVPDRKSA